MACKIIFLCTSLEPGRDGVGDYTRQLANELILQGHLTGILALNDKAITTEWSGFQTVDTIDIPALRVPAIWSLRKRFKAAKVWIDAMEPEWLSIQYVPFGYHFKGLPFGLAGQLAKLSNKYKWHVMFHELWVGSAIGASIKHAIWGWVQKKLIISLINRLQPLVMHTHSQLYQSQLRRIEIFVEILPLFSNIPILKKPSSSKLNRNKNQELDFITFGTLHPSTDVDALAKEVTAYSKDRHINISLTIIGHSNGEQQRWVDAWESNGIKTKLLGTQSPVQISKLLQQATIGISTTALAMIEKSSSVATMRAHGLPVLCVGKSWHSNEVSNPVPPDGILDYQPGSLSACLSNAEPVSFPHTVSSTTRVLINALNEKHI